MLRIKPYSERIKTKKSFERVVYKPSLILQKVKTDVDGVFSKAVEFVEKTAPYEKLSADDFRLDNLIASNSLDLLKPNSKTMDNTQFVDENNIINDLNHLKNELD